MPRSSTWQLERKPESFAGSWSGTGGYFVQSNLKNPAHRVSMDFPGSTPDANNASSNIRHFQLVRPTVAGDNRIATSETVRIDEMRFFILALMRTTAAASPKDPNIGICEEEGEKIEIIKHSKISAFIFVTVQCSWLQV